MATGTNPSDQTRRSKSKLQSQKDLSGIERTGEAQWLTFSKVTVAPPFEPDGVKEVINSGWISRCVKGCWDQLIHRSEVRTVQKIRSVGAELYALRTLSPEAERFGKPHIEAAVAWPDPGVAADVKKSIGSAACVAVDVRSGSNCERNAAPDEDAWAERHIRKDAGAEAVPGAGLERAQEDAADYEVIADIEGRQRSLRTEARGERGRKGGVEVSLIINRLAVGVIGLE